MLFARRQRLKDLEEQEAGGKSFWTEELPEQARVRLLYAIKDLTKGTISYTYSQFDLIEFARDQVLRDIGQPALAGQQDPERDVVACISTGSEDLVFSYLKAIVYVAAMVVSQDFSDVSGETRRTIERRLPGFVETVRTVLREHRVSFDLVDGQIIPLESLELHEEVVQPVVSLLG